METKNVNVTVNDGDSFFSNEASINFNPLQFFLDFKLITPRVDIRSKDTASISVKHNVVVVDPYHAKQLYDLFGTVIKKYEKEFGKIKKPDVVEIAEKKSKQIAVENKPDSTTPVYFG
jgi:hypothetical protein